ncbi:MAG: restriction endonuclease subunit S [Flavobacterium sp.]|jgi:type I restriction enzyme S subunit|nr:restriction endonuclease subunit S [Flavobacterium sp.]
MSKEKLIPELRFPEFKNDGEWEENVLSNITDAIFDGTHQTPTYTESGIPFFSVENIVSGNKNKFISKEDYEIATNKNKPEKGDILLTRIGKIGFSAIVDWDYEFSIYVTLACIKQSKQFNSYYLHSYFQSSTYQKEIFSKSLLNAVPMKINMDELRKTKVLFPPDIEQKEQQKIATCLSSLDEVIAAHSQKLDELKDYKKGLMQNLFPQEGEKVPKYRFKEFENDGEWELKPFSKYIKLYRGSSPRPIIEYQTQGVDGVNWIKIGDTGSVTDFVIRSVSEKITPKGAEKSRAVRRGELILANSMSYGSTYLLDIEGCIYDGWFVLREYDEVFDKQFLLQLLNSEFMQNQYKKLAAGGIVQNISSEIVYSTLLPKTSKAEQQKIASCLSSLDALITAQVQKIEQLKLHKKGLMQGLFPKIRE